MNLEQEQFFTADVMRAAGWKDKGSFQNMMNRGSLDIPYLKPGIGGRRLYTAEAAIQVAITRGLMEHGLSTEDATALARRATRWPVSLRSYLNDPQGNETLVTNLAGNIWEFCAADSTKEAAEHSPYPVCIIVRIGQIAREVLAELEAILRERR